MFTPSSPLPRKFIARQGESGFSLVEVVLAVGVIAFAFVAILGLLPAGLTQFRQAMDNSVASQIGQRILMDAQMSDFDVLTDTVQGHHKASSTLPFTSLIYLPTGETRDTRYFDEQGNEVIPQGATPNADEILKIVYFVNTRITPGPSLPGSVPNATADLGTAGAGVSMATVLVQVAFNPGGKKLEVDQTTFLYDTAVKYKAMPVRTYTAQIGRND